MNDKAACARPPWLRHLPNAITVVRLLAVPVLAWLAWRRAEPAFGALLVAALVSDILYGWIARRFGLGTRLGALLDSIADTALFFVAAYGMLVFHPGPVERYRRSSRCSPAAPRSGRRGCRRPRR
jgi:phosphatidylglycerophosphate synthase